MRIICSRWKRKSREIKCVCVCVWGGGGGGGGGGGAKDWRRGRSVRR